MERNKYVVNEYILSVYDDGTIDVKPYIKDVEITEVDSDVIDEEIKICDNCSDRVKQSLAVIEKTLISLGNLESDEVYVNTVNFYTIQAIKEVSSEYNVKENTIRDKVTRQIKFSQDQFVKSIYKYYKSKSVELKQQLLNNASIKRFFVGDQSLINKKFEEFDKLLYKEHN